MRAITLSLLLATTAVIGCSTDDVADEPLPSDGVLQLQDADLLFTYHLVSGAEGLFDRARDPECLRNLVTKRPVDAARLRKRLAERYGVTALTTLRESRREEIEHLESLGYL